MLILCFEPEPLWLKGLTTLGYLHANAQSPVPFGTGDTISGVITFGTTNPLLDHNGPQLLLLLISALGL